MAARNIIKLVDITPVVFTIIGISSHENDYRISWSINEQLRLSFTQGESVLTGSGKEFTCFIHEDDHQRLLLISNRCDDGFLLGKYKNFDFILKIEAELNETEMAAWLHDLRNVPLVSAAFPIPINKKVLRLLG